jgi:hypothetical protein
MPTPFARALSVALPLAAALPVPAQDADGIGTVTGTLDLDDARWVIAGAGETASTWREDDGTLEIRLVATPDAGGVTDAGTLTIDITADAGATEASVTSARVEMQGDGRAYIAGPENVDLSLTAVAPEGSDLALAGSLQATMTPGGAEGLVIETQAGRTLDGNFQATVPGEGAVN